MSVLRLVIVWLLLMFSSMAQATEQQQYTLYLEVLVNGQSTDQIIRFIRQGQQFFTSGQELRQLGVHTKKLGIIDSDTVDLTAFNIRYEYDPLAQSIDLHLSDQDRVPYYLGMPLEASGTASQSSTGLVLNYDLYGQTGGRHPLANFFSEQRFFHPLGILSNTGSFLWSGSSKKYTRYDTFLQQSNEYSLRTIRLGDTISSSLSWSRAVRLAGLQVNSDFSLRPDLITFPIPPLSGSAVVPSAVDLYINNVRQFSASVPSGPFILNHFPALQGVGNANLVVRDPAGREISQTVPIYLDMRLLAADLTSYSLEAGWMRRHFGKDSFRYDHHPVAGGTVRHGVNQQLTVEAHAEADHRVVVGGTSALLGLGQLGVINASVAKSSGRFSGTQFGLGYQWLSPVFNISAQSTRTLSHYGDLASDDGFSYPRSTDNFNVGFILPRLQNIFASYLARRDDFYGSARILSATYNITLKRIFTFSLSAWRDFEDSKAKGVFLNVSVPLGAQTASLTTIGHNRDENFASEAISKTPDYAGGWGYFVRADKGSVYSNYLAQASYLSDIGQVTATAEKSSEHYRVNAQMNGAVSLMDGSLHLSRQLINAFTLVSTDGIADVPILHENRLIGHSDHRGYYLIPNLNAYQANRVTLDTLSLPKNIYIETTEAKVVPRFRSGVLTYFPLKSYNAANVILIDQQGKFLPAGTSVTYGNERKTIVGHDGITFIDQLSADNQLLAQLPGLSNNVRCLAQFKYQAPEDDNFPTIGPITCYKTTY